MVKYQLRGVVDELRTAQSKAPNDVADILDECGYRTIWVNPFLSRSRFVWAVGRVLALASIPLVLRRVPNGALLFVQFPDSYSGWVGMHLLRVIKRWRHARIIMIVHDLATLRTKDPVEYRRQQAIVDTCLHLANVLVVHNRHMRNWLFDRGFRNIPMIDLFMFDYLTSWNPESRPQLSDFKSVMIPGYLALSKAAYLTELKNIDGVEWHLYGVAYDEKKISGEKIHYHGSYPPELLPSKLDGAFGLVWDGTSADTCQGVLGEYLMYNNPHKFSLFMAAGVPVIVWRKAAISDIVLKYDVGFVVDSLRDVPAILQTVTKDKYTKLLGNVKVVSDKVRNGYYLKRALVRAEHIVGQ